MLFEPSSGSAATEAEHLQGTSILEMLGASSEPVLVGELFLGGGTSGLQPQPFPLRSVDFTVLCIR